ncbi:MAG TPA: RcpC/CpaB family pilus assembly protein, partial [Xanthobacteraceae bacterium]|nr:RcpC/CpaB family pilus assembly protein [Xanthobacteraceae bacterium]
QNARVLAVDQIADDSTDKPAVVKAVTLEVDTVAAQKLSLASAIGALSLALRKAGEAGVEGTRQISVSDLGSAQAFVNAAATHVSTIGVTRASKRQEYTVPMEADDWREAAGAARK